MTKNEIVNYVVETPHNVNKRILGQQLDELQKNVSWNDLKDKPFGVEMVEEVILDWELEFLEQDEKWVMNQSIDRKPIDNEQITVIWNGEVNIANFVYNEDDNCFVCALPNGETLYAWGENTDWNYETHSRSAATVKVIAKNETVHKLDAKYLPKTFATPIVDAEMYCGLMVSILNTNKSFEKMPISSDEYLRARNAIMWASENNGLLFQFNWLMRICAEVIPAAEYTDNYEGIQIYADGERNGVYMNLSYTFYQDEEGVVWGNCSSTRVEV